MYCLQQAPAPCAFPRMVALMHMPLDSMMCRKGGDRPQACQCTAVALVQKIT